MANAFSVVLLTVVLLIVGCQKKPDTDSSVEASLGGSIVVAQVESAEITLNQLEFQLKKLFGDQLKFIDTPELREKILDSMIDSRALSLSMEKLLSEDEKADLDQQVESYREELLVNRFIEENAQPEPVTLAMIEQYYQENKEGFSGAVEYTFEYLASVGKLDDAERDQAINVLSEIDRSSDWSKAAGVSSDGPPIAYKKLTVDPDLLDPELKRLVLGTPSGQVSNLHVGKDIIRVRVIAERHLPAKPLSQVSADIRKKLAPIMLKKSLKKLTDEVKQEFTISKQ